MNQTDVQKIECRECKHVFLFTFAALLAFFLYTYFTRTSNVLLTSGASVTVVTSTSTSTAPPQLLTQ